MKTAPVADQRVPSWLGIRRRLAHSIKLRMVLLFLLLAAAMTLVFVTGAQKAFSLGWREAARPLLMDYVDRLAADVSPPGTTAPPSTEQARAITERLPLTVDIAGPVVNWRSHPDQKQPPWRQGDDSSNQWSDDKTWDRLVRRTTADGHTIEFGINEAVLERRPRLLGVALAAVLLLTLLAWLYVRRLLRPLDAIGEGARRFGAGDFSQPIALRNPQRPDELGELAATLNTMGDDIRQMLDAKRALLLAISHELRSPLTRARLHAELLPETGDTDAQRAALQPDFRPAGKRAPGWPARVPASRAGGAARAGSRSVGRVAGALPEGGGGAGACRCLLPCADAGCGSHAPDVAQLAGQRIATRQRRTASARRAIVGGRAGRERVGA